MKAKRFLESGTLKTENKGEYLGEARFTCTTFPNFDGNSDAFVRVICLCNPLLLQLYGMESIRAEVMLFDSVRRRQVVVN